MIYSDVRLACQLVTSDQALMLSADVTTAKRSRRGRVEAPASHTDTLADLKLRLYEGLKVHPRNMRVYVHGGELVDDRATLAALNVAANDVVSVVRDGVEDDANAASVVAYKEEMCSSRGRGCDVTAPMRTQGVERGFAHTALVGSESVLEARTPAA